MHEEIIKSFIDAINDHNPLKISDLITEDHRFIDAHENEISGKEKMKAAWSEYFQWFPDYLIEINEIFSKNDLVAAFGHASATFKGITTQKKENYWRIPASWKAIIKNNKIGLWQVYADTKIPYDIIGRNK